MASPAIVRAAAILSTLAQQPQRAFGPSELSRKTGMPKSSALNLCVAMESVGFLRREERGFRLHYRLAELGNAYLRSLSEIEEFYELCRMRLAGALQTVQLGVLGGGNRIVFLARHDGREPLNLGHASEIGRSVSAHCTANGKALLAALDPAELDTVLPRNGRLRAITNKTITSVKALLGELDTIRDRGYSSEQGETVHGLLCFGTTIRTPHRRDGLIGISFSYPETSLSKSEDEVGSELIEFSRIFAERIGGKLALVKPD